MQSPGGISILYCRRGGAFLPTAHGTGFLSLSLRGLGGR